MQDGLLGDHRRIVGAEGSAGVEVAIPAREVAAGNIQADAMPDLENVAGRPQVDLILVRLARLDQRWSFSLRESAVRRPDDPGGQIVRETSGVDIDQPSYDLGIKSAG